MNVGDIYPVVLTLVLIGLVIGVGILVLDNFSTSSSVTATAATSINETRDAIGDFSGWMAVIVIVVVAAVILGLVMRSFRA